LSVAKQHISVIAHSEYNDQTVCGSIKKAFTLWHQPPMVPVTFNNIKTTMCVVSTTIQKIDCQQYGKEKHTECHAPVLCCIVVGSVCSNEEDKPTIKLLVACIATALQQGEGNFLLTKKSSCVAVNNVQQ